MLCWVQSNGTMESITQILNDVSTGKEHSSDLLLPLIYSDLKRLAAARMASEKPGQTLQPTALVHEAYLRIVRGSIHQTWDSRAHFFAAASEAMRRILVESARRKSASKRGGDLDRVDFEVDELELPMESDQLIALDEALDRLATSNSAIAQLVRLRFFAGLDMEEAADILGVSIRTAHRQWLYAKAFLRSAMDDAER
jgi:RNA polymerase sigma factor (TIGR02999 family)